MTHIHTLCTCAHIHTLLRMPPCGCTHKLTKLHKNSRVLLQEHNFKLPTKKHQHNSHQALYFCALSLSFSPPPPPPPNPPTHTHTELRHWLCRKVLWNHFKNHTTLKVQIPNRYIWTHSCIYSHVPVCVWCVHACACESVWTCKCVFMCVEVCVCVSICIQVCLYSLCACPHS